MINCDLVFSLSYFAIGLLIYPSTEGHNSSLIGKRQGFNNSNRPALQSLALQSGNGDVAFRLGGHHHKSISPGLAAANVPVVHQDHGCHCSESHKLSQQFFLSNVKRQITHIDIHICLRGAQKAAPQPAHWTNLSSKLTGRPPLLEVLVRVRVIQYLKKSEAIRRSL
jgi:hypothetical protein